MTDQPEVSGIVTITLVMTVSSLVLFDASSALISAAIGVLLLVLYLGIGWLMDRRDGR